MKDLANYDQLHALCDAKSLIGKRNIMMILVTLTIFIRTPLSVKSE